MYLYKGTPKHRHHLPQQHCVTTQEHKQTPWPLVRKRAIPAEQPPPINEI
jgi:hypothetical protein